MNNLNDLTGIVGLVLIFGLIKLLLGIYLDVGYIYALFNDDDPPEQKPT